MPCQCAPFRHPSPPSPLGRQGGSFQIAAKQWCSQTKNPVKILAWPGWLDNAGSFDSIAPFFADAGFQFLACDPPGCGLSDHRPLYDWYLDYEEVGIIAEVATAMWGDEPFVLCGNTLLCP